MLQQPENPQDNWIAPASNGVETEKPFGNPHALRQHQHLLRLPEQASHLFRIHRGWAGRYRLLSDGRRQITALFLPGDICDPAWLDGGQPAQSVVALTAIEATRTTRAELEDKARRDNRTNAMLWRQLTRAQRIQAEWIFNLGRKTALERLSHLLCELYVRLSLAGQSEGTSCEMPLTQQDLADIAGLTPVHVNRTLQEMRALGLIDLHSRRLTIHDMPALQRTGWFDPHYLANGTASSGTSATTAD